MTNPLTTPTDEGKISDAEVEAAEDAFEKAAREWRFEQIGAEFVVNYVADRAEDFVNSPESQLFHRFASRQQALRFRRDKCLRAALLAASRPRTIGEPDAWMKRHADGVRRRIDLKPKLDDWMVSEGGWTVEPRYAQAPSYADALRDAAKAVERVQESMSSGGGGTAQNAEMERQVVGPWLDAAIDAIEALGSHP